MSKYLIILLFVNVIAFSQNYEDVVILKNGSEIHGIIIEQKPNHYIKIKSGRNTFVYNFDEIELLKKVLITSTISSKKHSIGIGLGTNKTMNFIQYTHDLKLSESFSIYGLFGFPNLTGLGVAWQQNYNDNGLMLGWSGGVDVTGWSFGSLALSYQWRLGQTQNFFSLGLVSYAYTIATRNKYFGWSTEIYTIPFPVLSIDRRFGF